RTATRLGQPFARVEAKPAGEAARWLDVQALSLASERLRQVLEMVQQLRFAHPYAGRQLLERRGSVAQRSRQRVADGLAASRGRTRTFDLRPAPRPSAIVAPSTHVPRMLATDGVGKPTLTRRGAAAIRTAMQDRP